MIWSHNIKISCYGSLLNQFTIALINNCVASVLNYLLLREVSYIIYRNVLRTQSHQFCWSRKYFYCFYFWENVQFIWWIIFFKYKKFETRTQEKVDDGGLSVIFSRLGALTLWKIVTHHFLQREFMQKTNSMKNQFCSKFRSWTLSSLIPHSL